MRPLPTEPAMRTHNLVLAEVARASGSSRSDVAKRLGVNLATVSRASRDLIDCGLLEETGNKEVKGPGRPFIGLTLRGAGGYIIGIGVNAFRQSVTLASLRNEKLAEWIAPEPPGKDGAAFLETCIEKAKELIDASDLPPDRLFGVGLAIAAEINRASGIITDAPTFGWSDKVNIRQMVSERLQVPLAIETPSLAITQAEAEFGSLKDIRNIVTLHCSLGFGMGVRRSGETGGSVDFGRVLTRAQSSTPEPELLDGLCGGLSVLNEIEGVDQIAILSDLERARLLTATLEQAETRKSVATILEDRGRLTGQHFSLLLDVLRPDVLLLAGPLAQSSLFVAGVTDALGTALAARPEVRTTDMTPTGASRWLSLRANVLLGNIDFSTLKKGLAA